MGIPIVFDESVPPDTFYIVSNSLEAKHQRALDRILTGVRQSTRSTPALEQGRKRSKERT